MNLPPPPTGGSTQPKAMPMRVSLADIVTAGRKLPARILCYAVEGWGKTSFGAQFPAPVFLMDHNETGLETLIDAGRLPEVSHFPPVDSWEAVLATLQALTTGEHEYKTLVVDTLGGIERLCHEHVCQRDYQGVWGDKGFMSFHKGFETAKTDWRVFLAALDVLRETRGIRIVCLAHARTAPFRNPEGEDYDRYQADMHAKTWGLTHGWADMVLFGNYVTAIDEDGKGRGGTQRIMRTERSAAYDAKNRHGLAPMIDLGQGVAQAYDRFCKAMEAGRQS